MRRILSHPTFLVKFFWVARNNPNPEVLNVLISEGAILEAKNLWGRTVLHYAAANENPAIFDWLKQNENLKLDFTLQDDNGKDCEYYRVHPDEF